MARVSQVLGEAGCTTSNVESLDLTVVTVGGGDLVTTRVADAQAFVVWGYVDGRADPAEHLSRSVGGQDATASGSYGAAIVGLDNVRLTGDLVGQRSLRAVAAGGVVAVSPHDVILAAAVMDRVDIDALTAASIAVFGWSVADHSLVSGIIHVSPGMVVDLSPSGRLEVRRHPALAGLGGRARLTLPDVRERTVAAMRDYLTPAIECRDHVDVELSAGFDSRAVLACALSVAPPERFRAFTDGMPGSMDVDIAARVAATLRVPHRYGKPSEDGLSSDRIDLMRNMAVENNGGDDALVSMTNRVSPLEYTTLCGDGGEIFRGYYYPKVAGPQEAAATGAAVAAALWRKAQGDLADVRPDLRLALESRVLDRGRMLAELGGGLSDSLDLLYLLERFAVWNKKTRVADRTRVSPFYSRRAIAGFLSFPPPRGTNAHIHETLITRYAGPTLPIPINREVRLDWLLGGPVARVIGKGWKLAEKIRRKVSNRLPSRRPAVALADERFVRFRSFLDTHSGTFTKDDSVTVAALGPESAGSVVRRGLEGHKPSLQILGSLLPAEYLVLAAREAVSKGSHGPRTG